MRQNQRLEGFDYRKSMIAELTLREWEAEFVRVLAAGGRVKRIGGDRTAFDSHGVMQFEVHDAQLRSVVEHHVSSERNRADSFPQVIADLGMNTCTLGMNSHGL